MVAGQKINLIVIVGPTATGKSDLAMKIAEKFNGEIIAADSRTIYKGMDIGTAKPSLNNQKKIKHWGVDLIEPGQTFSAAIFKEYAEDKIINIQKRGKLPILVGGTGLYIDGVIFDFHFIDGGRPNLGGLTVDQLQAEIRRKGYQMPANKLNKRHLIRTIERQGLVGKKNTNPLPGTLIIGLLPNDITIKKRISTRAELIFDSGIEIETTNLIAKHGEQAVYKSGIVYKICTRLINGEISEDKAKQLFKIADWQYAKRQKTWFKRNKFIQWFSSSDEAFTAVTKLLNNQSRNTSP